MQQCVTMCQHQKLLVCKVKDSHLRFTFSDWEIKYFTKTEIFMIHVTALTVFP